MRARSELVVLTAVVAALGGPAPAASHPTGGAPVPDGWLGQVERDLATREYELSWQSHPTLPGLDAAWQAPNRAQGFRTYFTETGIRVVPRTEEDPSWVWGLSLVGYGRGPTVWPVGEARLSPTGNRLDSRRGTVDEWYVNDSKGLKQGFQLWAPPEAAAGQGSIAALAGRIAAPGRARGLEDAGLVHLDIELQGELLPVVAADGQAIDFVTPAGVRALRYAELVVTDARGDVLPAWMEGVADGVVRGIRLVVDDREAIYPITIDPLATSPAWTADGVQSGDFFGVSVATAGDVNGDGYGDVIVGAEGYDNGQTDEGRAYAYHGSASGLSLTPNWTAESDQASAAFGHTVATAGDVNGDGYGDVIVGAHLYDVTVGATTFGNAGQAYVYHGSPSGLSSTANWTASTNQGGGSFGNSAATAGDVNGDGYGDVIVGAYLWNTSGQPDEGLALVYLGSGTGLSSTAVWSVESNQPLAHLGYAVGTAGDVNGDGYADVIIGALDYDDFVDGQTDAGRAWVYHGNASGVDEFPSWTGEGNQSGARYGVSVGTAGDVNGDGYADVIVGARDYDDLVDGYSDAGRAWVYHGQASGVDASPSWSGEGNQSGAHYGVSVGTAGDVNGDGYADVIIGAFDYDDLVDGYGDAGRAWVYHGNASGVDASPSWSGEGNQSGARYGVSVGTAGDVNGDGYADVIVGASLFDVVVAGSPVPDAGRAFVYLGSASGPATSAGWTAEGGQTDSAFGTSVGTAGDINGDGYADVIVGAPGFDNGQTDEGRAFVYHGSASGLSSTPNWTAEGDQADAAFGSSVATAGDVNGDGYADVIVGATGFDNGQTDGGRAFVYHGSASGLSSTPSWTEDGLQAGANFGVAVGTAGDVNADGYADVIVGAYDYDNPNGGEGRAFVYHGAAAGLSSAPNWTAEGDQADADFGSSVATAGDVNGDGYADVIVGAPLYDLNGTNAGRAFVYHGSAFGLATSPNWAAGIFPASGSALFGGSVGTAGDVNADGYADVIVGAVQFANGAGRASVYHGSSSGLNQLPSWTAEGLQEGARFGISVGTAGDVNGDGYADVIVGQSWNFPFGRALVYFGSASALPPTPSWTATGTSAEFGASVASAGDVNGDGHADVIVGDGGATNGEFNEGQALVYLGNGGGGPSVRPQQRRADDTAPIAPMGGVAGEAFRLAALGRTPFGRGLVKLEWEVKPLGTPLNGTGLQSGAVWLDTGTIGVALNEVVSGLAVESVHHWRLRMRYHPVTSPFQRHSRWITVPWNGWQEGDFRTLAEADLSVTQADSPDPLLLGSGGVTYSVGISNSGPDDVPVSLTYTLQPCAAFSALATPSQGTCGLTALNVVTCSLGLVAAGGQASVAVPVTPQTPGQCTNSAAVSITAQGTDPNLSDNVASETTTVLPVAPGDRAWEDTDGDGVQDPGEPGLADVLVALYNGAGIFLDATVTDGAGAYSFPSLTLGATYRLRFFPPTGYVLSVKDQGADDLLDSDADPVTLLTPAFALTSVEDPFRWDVGMRLACFPPDEPVFIANVTMTPQGVSILHMQDPNQLRQVTGYNIYRSSDPSPPPGTWPLLASDVLDMDAGTPNIQWVDDSGDPPPGEVWFYNATAYSHDCPAEGPF